ncbi:MAG: hypothetical protein J6W55_05520, partial [Acidaminococcaceae bacterium]|nr:hypothetical protein [Acidaminococcaceae bacterium]
MLKVQNSKGETNIMVTRRLLQIWSAVLYNCNLISDIPAKYINSEFCVPGLNCRYCPASVADC